MIPYIGGKSSLAKFITQNFPENSSNMTYAEVFGGGGWVLFKKEVNQGQEVYNDLNKNLVNLFRIIRDNFNEFQYRANWTFHSREMFKEAVEKFKDDKFLDDTDRALSYAIKQIQSFSGTGTSWGYAFKSRSRGLWLPFLNRLKTINDRLQGVQIECLDFEPFIKKYDRPETLFYVDPPYYECENYYNKEGVNFTKEDHLRLFNILSQIKGKFVLSYYDHPAITELYKDYRIIKKEMIKSACGVTRLSKKQTRPKSVELLIMNY